MVFARFIAFLSLATVVAVLLARMPAKADPLDVCKSDVIAHNYSAGISDCTKAIEQKPDDAEAYSNRCRAYAESGNYDAAISDCTKAISLGTTDAGAFGYRCFAFVNKGDYQSAIPDCSKGAEMDPTAAAYLVLAYADVQAGKNAEAIQALNKELAFQPPYQPGNAYALRCQAYLNRNDFQPAVADCTQAISLNTNDSTVYDNRCSAYSQSGQLDAAIADCTQAIALNQNDTRAYGLRMVAYAQAGNSTAAIADCARAIALDLHDALGFVACGFVYEAAGNDKVKALDYYKQALAIDPSNQLAQAAVSRMSAP